jgi:hypothetical protein
MTTIVSKEINEQLSAMLAALLNDKNLSLKIELLDCGPLGASLQVSCVDEKGTSVIDVTDHVVLEKGGSLTVGNLPALFEVNVT